MTLTKIVNVVMTSNLNQRIDLFELKKHPDIIHDTAVYGGRVAYYKSPRMKGRVTIFPSGKLIGVGTQSEKEAEAELESTKEYLIKRKIITDVLLHHKVENIVAVANLGEIKNFEKLLINYDVLYSPDQFPAGILKIIEPSHATVLIFKSGKVVIAGLKSENQIEPIEIKLLGMINSSK